MLTRHNAIELSCGPLQRRRCSSCKSSSRHDLRALPARLLQRLVMRSTPLVHEVLRSVRGRWHQSQVAPHTHPGFRATRQPSPRRSSPWSGAATGTDSVLPSAERRTPRSALRRPYCAEGVKLLNNILLTPGTPTLLLASEVPLPPADIVSTGRPRGRHMLHSAAPRKCILDCGHRQQASLSGACRHGRPGVLRDVET
jgi:hypothetical protein